MISKLLWGICKPLLQLFSVFFIGFCVLAVINVAAQANRASKTPEELAAESSQPLSSEEIQKAYVIYAISITGSVPEIRTVDYGREDARLLIKVSDSWHSKAHQVRYRLAKGMYKTWRHALDYKMEPRFTLQDVDGNKIGGTSLLGRIWVRD